MAWHGNMDLYLYNGAWSGRACLGQARSGLVRRGVETFIHIARVWHGGLNLGLAGHGNIHSYRCGAVMRGASRLGLVR